MKLKNILHRIGDKASLSSKKTKKKKHSSSSEGKNDDPLHDDGKGLLATNTGSTDSYSKNSGLVGVISDFPHGSGIFVDTAGKGVSNDVAHIPIEASLLQPFNEDLLIPHVGDAGRTSTTGPLRNDVGLPQNVASPTNMKNTSGGGGKQNPPPKTMFSSLSSLDFNGIIQSGYSAISCVSGCRPETKSKTKETIHIPMPMPIPTVVNPSRMDELVTQGIMDATSGNEVTVHQVVYSEPLQLQSLRDHYGNFSLSFSSLDSNECDVDSNDSQIDRWYRW